MRPLTVIALALVLGACGGGSPTTPAPVVAPMPAPTPSPTPSPAGGPAPTPSPTPDPAPTPPPTVAVVRTASITGANGHAASGTAEIVQRGAAQTLELRGDFRIDGGLNDVYLTRDTGRPGSGDLNLGNLRSLTGAQSYPIPGDGTRYRYVLIWCRPFQVPIGIGRLR